MEISDTEYLVDPFYSGDDNSPSFSWQENDGNFHSYDAANMKLLQKAYKLNANGDVVIHQGG
ncbi:hypothetical protein, partial [Salmonella sp. s51228]|uniref:hypothetical protein n=1 Tax=Salmonella sp. s51228 TaxID=3159652 RepID=UPI00397EC175